jgi:hypothetical protein
MGGERGAARSIRQGGTCAARKRQGLQIEGGPYAANFRQKAKSNPDWLVKPTEARLQNAAYCQVPR